MSNPIFGNDANNVLYGGAGNDTLYGQGGNDTLYGQEGNDTLIGGTGADTLIGGIGNDTYVVDNTGDVVSENANEGTDTVVSSITYTLGDNVENLALIGNENINGTGNKLNNALLGNDVNNVLDGAIGNDSLYGQGGNDTLIGSEGNDYLDGGIDTDSLIGGIGNDSYVVDNIKDVVIENANEGIDTVLSSINYTLGDNLENLVLTGEQNINGTGNSLNNTIFGNDVNNVVDGGSGNDTLYGQGGNDTLIGGEGNDTVIGGTGADSLIGGIGKDSYVVDNIGDVVIENANEGTDTVLSSITYTLVDNVENLALIGEDNINGTGNKLNNALLGNDGNNILDGASGNDNLSGQGGNDTVIGGEGNDTVIGGEGNDSLDGGTGTDSLIGGLGNDTYVVDNLEDKVVENANEGIDTVVSSITYTLGDNLENLTLTGNENIDGTGNDLNNTLLGNDGNNILDGGSGNDNVFGQGGNDSLIGGEGNDSLIGGEGNDTLIGGVGMDAFRFTSLDRGIDTIADFESGTDKIQIDSSGFTGGLAIGQLSKEAFTFGAGVTSATSSSHRFIFNTTNGDLFFDADGDGAGTSVKIASLNNSASLSHSDIFVI